MLAVFNIFNSDFWISHFSENNLKLSLSGHFRCRAEQRYCRSVNEKFDFTICTAEYNTGLQADKMATDFGDKIISQKMAKCEQLSAIHVITAN